jgi:hypothetical protein
MPAAGATAIGTGGRFGGQEAIDLSVCLTLLKKTIVTFPLLIMIVLYLIRSNMATQDHSTQQPNMTRMQATNASPEAIMDDFQATPRPELQEFTDSQLGRKITQALKNASIGL